MVENNVVRFDGQPERRRTRRYALEQELRYRVSYRDPLSQTGIGWLINISLSGILFKSERPIFPGAPLTVVMNCAGVLVQTPPTELMIQGRILRSNEKEPLQQSRNMKFAPGVARRRYAGSERF